MNTGTLTTALYSVLENAALLVAVPLITATIVGFGIGLLQAVTQLQEQTLPQSMKMFVVSLVLLVFGGALSAPLYATAQSLFDTFYLYGKH